MNHVDFAYSTDQIHNIPVLALSGRFDAHQKSVLNAWFEETLPSQAPCLVVDLRSVNFMDSAALSLLVAWMRRCLAAGGKIKLANLSKAARVTLELTRLDRVFEIHEDVVGAVYDILDPRSLA